MPDLSQLVVSDIDEPTRTWLIGILDVIETLDADAYARHMTEDVTLRLPDGSQLTGRDQVVASLRASWKDVTALRHVEINIHGTDRQIVHEAWVDVVTTDEQHVRTANTSWIDRAADGRISAARIYS